MGGKRIDWEAIEKSTRLGSIPWRYFRSKDDRLCIWTTRTLYRGGDYAAYLCESDGTLLARRYFALRKEARATAHLWCQGLGIQYTIEEEP